MSNRQDKQSIVKPARLTQTYGIRKGLNIGWSYTKLPDNSSNWHVYQIGGIHPLIFNYFVKCRSWTSFAQCCNEQKMMADIYTGSGIQLPRFDSYYQYTENGTLIVAIKINPKLKIDFNKDGIYIRVYSNAFFHQSFAEAPMVVKGLEYKADKLTELQTWSDEYSSKEGLLQWFRNGLVYKRLEDIPLSHNDLVEMIYDKSVYKVKSWKISDLLNFESTLDDKRKFLLHYSGDKDDFRIDYQDDIDVYVLEKTVDGYKGIYYHKNHLGALRNLSHRDYSVVTDYVRQLVKTYSTQVNAEVEKRPQDLYIQLHIREGGLSKTLQFEHNRIRELYKLDDEDIIDAMVGMDANVSVWKAANLEASDTVKIMGSEFNDVSIKLAEKAYRYNAASKYLGDSPVKLAEKGKDKTVELPLRLRHGCTAYEYDEQGLLIGWYHHYTGVHYVTKNEDCQYVELIAGLGGHTLDEYIKPNDIQLSEVLDFRVYLASNVANKLSPFKDVTGSDKYSYENGVFNWLSQDSTDYPVLRTDKRFLAKDLLLNLNQGMFRFELTAMQDRGHGLAFYALVAPLAQLDIFLNGKSLIQGLDYFYLNNEIFITNKEYLVDPLNKDQKVHVRFSGFCNKDLSFLQDNDVGFIEHGLLSNNNRYDIRDDKVQKVIIDGRLYHKNELVFSELHQGVGITDEHNGKPYIVKDIFVPVKPYTVNTTFELREQSLNVDKMVSDYMSLKLPQPQRTPLMVIAKKHRLYSPFLTKLIMDMKKGLLDIPLKAEGYSRELVLKLCKPYEDLLKADPLHSTREQDERFVSISAHPLPYPIVLQIHQYQFLNKVVQEYGRGLVELSGSIKSQ